MKSPVKFSFSKKPQEAIKYLKNKGFKLTFNYDEMLKEAHHQAFTVAKVTRLDLLNDIHTSLLEAKKSGMRFDTWRDKLQPTLAEKGWWGVRDVVDPKTGEVKKIYIGSKRLKTIFNTNMRVAYNVERYKAMRELDGYDYWLYISMMLSTSRDKHKAMHHKAIHRDDPFWQTNYPPNAWNCKCKVRAYSKKQIEKRKIDIVKKPAKLADKDWAYNVGKGSQVAKLAKLNLGTGLQYIKPNKNLDKLTNAQLKARFYRQLNTKKDKMFIDKVGDPMFIGDELFTTSKGVSKVKKRQRHLYIDELAKTIASPDEIYLELEQLPEGKTRLVKKMFRYFQGIKGGKKASVAMFEYLKDKTQGITTYVIDGEKTINKKRMEKLIYQKPKAGSD